ncbi:family 10 glycosylhydrolase [[Phormidium] sp. ETS-05]|uniref:glycoside hydrolase family 10 protein n=1 Tax=[Phormidium] sp. ETS-05 TaxID=222819 RepID=UPI0018EEF699|nr:family 10 glycosylhydrolase [[Phormidium] sp. ETS-05]
MMAVALSDIKAHWAEAAITELARMGVVAGYPDGSFRPNASLTRTEFAVILTKAFPNLPKKRSGGNFVDVLPNFWAAGAIRTAFETGFMAGYPGGKFGVQDKILRLHVLLALASGLSLTRVPWPNVTLNRAFTDAAEIPGYAREAIAAAVAAGLVVSYPDGRNFHPNWWATRAEVVAMLCRSLMGAGAPVPEAYVARVPADELRGVWLTDIDSDVMHTPENLRFALDRLSYLNFNTIYPNVWKLGYTLYPSPVARQVLGAANHPYSWLQGRDLLAEIVTGSQRQGLSVIPWFEYGFMAPPNSELARRHPQWLTRKRDGSQTIKESGVDRVWLNPWHPQVQQFIKDLVLEIVGNYPVDGIQFDDHFSVPVELGYDDYTVNLYREEHLGLLPPEDPNDQNWRRWRSQKLTAYIRDLFKAIKTRRPNTIISLSPNYQDFAYNFYLQDWRTWQRYGFVEELILQVYRDDLKAFTAELQRPEVKLAQRNIPTAVGILTGLRTRGVPISQVEEQLNKVRNLGLAGSSFFFYESIWNFAPESPSDRAAAIKKMFPDPASRPSIAAGWQPIING